MTMIKNRPAIKKELSIEDKINMTKYLVSGYFISDEYTPYYRGINEIIAFFTYCVSGIEFETQKDTDGKPVKESVYLAVTGDNELMELWRKRNTNCSATLKSQLNEIYNDVSDIIDFEKQKLVHSSTSVDKKVMKILEKEEQNKDYELKLMKETEHLQKEQLKQFEYANKISEMMTPEEIVELNRLMIKNGEYNPNDIVRSILSNNYKN